MALNQAERDEIFAVLDATNRHKGKGVLPPMPEEYLKFPELCEEREDIIREADGYKYNIYVFKAKNRKENCPVYISIHGGGFVAPHRDNDWMFAAYMADQIQGIVVDLDYTTSDQAPFPTALHQCYDAAKYTFAQCKEWKADSNRVSMGGYSAGGSLTAGTALMAAESEEFHLCLQILCYPALDNVMDPIYQKDSYDRAIPLERGNAFMKLYFDGDMEAAASPFASPLYAPEELLEKLPRTLMISAGQCNFRYENEEYAAMIARAGVETAVKRFPDDRHGFIPHLAGNWKAAAELMARTIRNS